VLVSQEDEDVAPTEPLPPAVEPLALSGPDLGR
jgi:hypothetical protein